ncbi:MBL fold metallo-hydrolase [Marinifilum sp. D714]|uniref:MBL fold metallo-hydrolase n=1 Tax=Marinifilum sp. D714 TaxID=2937523 RepID=UPI0027C65454|nr:MBL fold metallo-hydrolase [Marinifilum sp. D714]MDQ2177076.1 MBL fold metallo-hydrolase [Marinifilum sp. D714]
MKRLKKMGIGLGILLLITCIIGVSFIYVSPQFGRRANATQKKAYALLPNYKDGKFINREKIEMEMSMRSFSKMFREMLSPDPNVNPKSNVEVVSLNSDNLELKADSINEVIWLGHSSFLIRLNGKTILLDPVFSEKTGPHSFFGRKKYNNQMPIDLIDIPHVDAIFISHDHYDHLDYYSIVNLKDKTDRFFVPLGVGNHLTSWKVDESKIQEFNWWDESSFEGIQFAFTPTRHMSGRGLADQSSTLWGSWVLKGKDKSIYFSGDGGYGEHFKEIGEKYGPFDIGLMECGQYNKLWADVHMMPEESVQAGLDVKAKRVIPIHWGSYRLANHAWTEPVERFKTKAKELEVTILTPRIGENINLNQHDFSQSTEWWVEIAGK